jgi:hypothetical protein
MNAIEYYNEQFGRELLMVMNSRHPDSTNRLSILSLADDARLPQGMFDDHAANFRRVESKPRFLFCYYFSALIDQAIHSRLRELHASFDHYARYPKFCGILGSYWTNFHPNLILLVATLYVRPEDEEVALEDCGAYASFFPNDYCEFLREHMPKLANVHTADGGKAWCEAVLDEVQIAAHSVPTSLPLVQRAGKPHCVRHWLGTLAAETARKIAEIRSS